MENDVTEIRHQVESVVSGIEQRREKVDQRFTEVDAALAEAFQRISILEAGDQRCQERLDQIQSIKPPGLPQLWGPAIASCVAIAGILIWSIRAEVAPIQENVSDIKQRILKLEDRQYVIRQDISEVQALTEKIDEHLQDVDEHGSRKWNTRPVP